MCVCVWQWTQKGTMGKTIALNPSAAEFRNKTIVCEQASTSYFHCITGNSGSVPKIGTPSKISPFPSWMLLQKALPSQKYAHLFTLLYLW